MPLAPEGSINTFRMVNRASMPHVAKILTPATVAAAGGRAVSTYPDPADVHEGVPCRVSVPGSTPQERLVADGFEDAPEYVVVFDAGTVIPPESRLYIEGATRGRDWALTLEVKASPPERTGAVQAKYLCMPIPRGTA